MIDQNKEPESKEKEELPEVCGRCASWGLLMMNPQNKIGMGACGNKEDEMAPYGVMTVSFGGCQAWKVAPPVSKIVTPAPKSISNNRRLRI